MKLKKMKWKLKMEKKNEFEKAKLILKKIKLNLFL